MKSFDEDYLARREKQIKELYELRAMIVVCLVTGVILALIGAGLLGASNGTLGAIVLAFALVFGIGSLFMTASYFAEKAADRAIREEYEQLMLYTKPKRGNQEEAVRLSEDGELIVDDDAADHASYQQGREG